MPRLVLLDRDGVINIDQGHGITRIEDFKIIPGVASAIAALNTAGILVAVATNQACVGRGELSLAGLDAIHALMHKELAKEGAYLDKIYYCPDATPSPRRKPAPGMLLEALADFGANAVNTPFVGDAVRDIEAAIAAGCLPVLLQTGKGQESLDLLKQTPVYSEVAIYSDLPSFVEAYLKESAP
ncbi:MAG: D-glycero-alpha-D-manno-heptose-1,7-bisphosphate 7-phosphatase [Holosporales bacterium]|jgi:D-glycero-D-manno-heptose 1,7-bisphosphate phosphatase